MVQSLSLLLTGDCSSGQNANRQRPLNPGVFLFMESNRRYHGDDGGVGGGGGGGGKGGSYRDHLCKFDLKLLFIQGIRKCLRTVWNPLSKDG